MTILLPQPVPNSVDQHGLVPSLQVATGWVPPHHQSASAAQITMLQDRKMPKCLFGTLWARASAIIGMYPSIEADPGPGSSLRPYSAAHVERGFKSPVRCYLLVSIFSLYASTLLYTALDRMIPTAGKTASPRTSLTPPAPELVCFHGQPKPSTYLSSQHFQVELPPLPRAD